MTAMQHLYLTAVGEYDTGAFVGETAQIGFRFAFAPTVSSPVMGETFAMEENGDAVPDFGSLASTNGLLTKTWTARVGPVGSAQNWGDDEQAAAAEATRTLLNSFLSYQSDEFRWTVVHQAPIDSLGHTIGTASTWTMTAPLRGAATAPLPPQLAVAVSSRANIVGRTGRGRFYLPALGTTLIGADGYVPAAAKTALTASFKTYIDAMQGVLGGLTTHRAVYVITSSGKATAVRPSEVRVGSLVDTIRSRRAQIDEVYTSLNL